MTSGVLLWLGAVVALAIVISLIVKLIRAARRKRLRAEVQEHYGLVDLPDSVTIRSANDEVAAGWVQLTFPRWQHPRVDGTADRRHRINLAIQGPSTLRLSRHEVVARDPLLIYRIAQQARRNGATIALLPAEREKLNRLERNGSPNAGDAAASDIDALILRFAERPIGFEKYCADLFRARGFHVQETPPTRDGGFDLVLERRGKRYLVECKCYAKHQTIGRPHLQKLAGANTIQRADVLVFITTSRFSADAIAFAEQIGMRLVDGPGLSKLASRRAAATPSRKFGLSDVELSQDELLSYYPADMLR